MKLKTSITLFLVISSLLCSPSAFTLEKYNGYPSYSIGDYRIIGMAGAHLGLSEDLNVANYNPAGVAFNKTNLMVDFSRQVVYEKRLDYNEDGELDGMAPTYLFTGITHFFEDWGFGTGLILNQPFRVYFHEGASGEDPEVEFDLSITSLVIPFAFDFNEKLSAGIGLEISSVYERFYIDNKTGFVLDESEEISNLMINFGLMYKLRYDLILSLVYKPGHILDIDETKNSKLDFGQDGKVIWFRDINIPHRIGFGAKYSISNVWLVASDVNFISGQKDTIYFGSKLLPEYTDFPMVESGVVDFHIGTEYQIHFSRIFQLNFMGGYFYQPKRIKNSFHLDHVALGLMFRVWAIYFGAGVDVSNENFAILSTTLGIKFSILFDDLF